MKMKKIGMVMVVILCISMLFVGCSATPSKAPGDGVNESTTSQETVFGLTDTAVFDTMNITATAIEENTGKDFFAPDAGNVFVGVNFTVENTSSSDISLSSIMLFEAYVDGVKCDYSLNAACAFDSKMLDGTIAPGKKLVGWYAVEVPTSWQELEVQFNDDIWGNSASAAKFVFSK